MENYDPIGGGFLVQKILDFIFGVGSFDGDFGTIYAILGFFKVLFLVLSTIFICGIVYVIHELQKLRPGYKLVVDPSKVGQPKIAQMRWKEIKRRMSIGTESEWRLAIIEADSLIDEVFKKMGFSGDTLGDRINSISQQELNSINELREAHGVRNRLVHTPGYKVSQDDAERAIRRYERVLEELEVI